MTEARLYYEAHITVQKPPISTWDAFVEMAQMHSMKASRFDVDEVDHYDGAWFLSYRNKDLETTKSAIKVALFHLENHGWIPIRWKIEDTVLDSKHGDEL